MVTLKMSKTPSEPKFGQIKTASELGKIIRTFRKSHDLTLEKVSGLSHLSMRFLSELERGKETAELGKVLETLNKLGLEVIIQPRGQEQKPPREAKKQLKDVPNEN
jgi:HTH-type transcriptional regulator/antitoxin HipB